jgi:hypothetical protein
MCSRLDYSMRRSIMNRVIMSALVVASLAPLPGSTLLQLSLNDMILKSTTIVHATVQASYSDVRGSVIYTHYQVQVTKSYKGAVVSTLDLAVPGGVLNGAQQSVAGAPSLTAGQDYFMFLWTSKNGLTQIIGLSQGLFQVITNSSGQVIVSRAGASERMLNSSGQIITDLNIQMPLTQMVNRIQNVLAGGTGQ